jgi:hypothetical protein
VADGAAISKVEASVQVPWVVHDGALLMLLKLPAAQARHCRLVVGVAASSAYSPGMQTVSGAHEGAPVASMLRYWLALHVNCSA